jgi:hypothetical protein
MGKDLEGKQLLGRGDETAEARQIQDGGRGRILTLEEALDRVIQPAGRKIEPLSDDGSSVIDGALGLNARCIKLAGGSGRERRFHGGGRPRETGRWRLPESRGSH